MTIIKWLARCRTASWKSTSLAAKQLLFLS